MPDAKMQSSTNPITELKVSGHLMTMDEGLFCIFNTPGAALPDGDTGLPGVCVTAAPGRGGFAGQVSISGFNGDGWLGGDAGAALVRVTGGPAQVLVTIYQAADGAHDAPKLQVIRLTNEVAPGQAAPAPEPPQQQPATGQPIEVAAHIYGRGDVGGRFGDWMGEPGSKRWIEGFGLAPGAGIAAADIEYQAVLGRGWLSPWVEGGQFCGSRGMSLPILGLRVRLRNDAAADYAVQVSATFVDGSRVGPVTDGSACEAPSLSPLEAFQITLTPTRKQAVPAPVAPKRAAPRKAVAAPVPEPAPAKPARRSKAQPAAAPVSPAVSPPAPAKRPPATTRRR